MVVQPVLHHSLWAPSLSLPQLLTPSDSSPFMGSTPSTYFIPPAAVLLLCSSIVSDHLLVQSTQVPPLVLCSQNQTHILPLTPIPSCSCCITILLSYLPLRYKLAHTTHSSPTANVPAETVLSCFTLFPYLGFISESSGEF